MPWAQVFTVCPLNEHAARSATLECMVRPLTELPFPDGRIPFLGDVRSVDRKNPTQHEMQLVAQLGPIYQRLLLRDRLIVVGGGELARQCLDEKNWARALIGPGAKLRDVAGSGLFTARSSDPLWGQARRILTPGFSQEAMRVYHRAMQSVADDLTAKWKDLSRVSVHEDMTAATLEVIARAGFSQSMGLLGEPVQSSETQEFLAALGRTLDWASQSSNDLPVIGWVRSRQAKPQLSRDVAFAQQYVEDLIRVRRRKTGANIGEDPDLLDLMMNSEDPETGETLPDENIRDQVLTFLVAGHETTAALMEVALHYLAADRTLAATLRSSLPKEETTYEAIVKNRPLRSFLNECLRLWPPVPGFFRVARTDQHLGGFEIPSGRAVFVLALAAQRDHAVWGADAAEFRTSRFTDTRITARSGEFFAPWGAGPRSCIGRQFALHEAAVLLSGIVTSFDVELADPHAPIRMRERGTLRPEPFTIEVSPATMEG